MNKLNFKSKIAAVTSAFLLLFGVACTNNNQTTKSAPDSPNGSVSSNDTAMSNSPAPMDTTTTAIAPEPTAVKKQNPRKGKASIGTITTNKSTTMKADRNGVYETTEIRPAFPGGQPALEDYITNHIEYPQMAVDDSKEGTVNVQFVIDENGKVTNAKLVGADLGDGLGDEAVRVISAMPKWDPGKIKGKNVKTRLTLPITYKIEE